MHAEHSAMPPSPRPSAVRNDGGGHICRCRAAMLAVWSRAGCMPGHVIVALFGRESGRRPACRDLNSPPLVAPSSLCPRPHQRSHTHAGGACLRRAQEAGQAGEAPADGQRRAGAHAAAGPHLREPHQGAPPSCTHLATLLVSTASRARQWRSGPMHVRANDADRCFCRLPCVYHLPRALHSHMHCALRSAAAPHPVLNHRPFPLAPYPLP